jgi:hypothetical protein
MSGESPSTPASRTGHPATGNADTPLWRERPECSTITTPYCKPPMNDKIADCNYWAALCALVLYCISTPATELLLYTLSYRLLRPCPPRPPCLPSWPNRSQQAQHGKRLQHRCTSEPCFVFPTNIAPATTTECHSLLLVHSSVNPPRANRCEFRKSDFNTSVNDIREEGTSFSKPSRKATPCGPRLAALLDGALEAWILKDKQMHYRVASARAGRSTGCGNPTSHATNMHMSFDRRLGCAALHCAEPHSTALHLQGQGAAWKGQAAPCR